MQAASLCKADYQTIELLKQLRPAGTNNNGVLETAKDALTWQDRPATPEELKPYQHYARQPAGTILKHFGTARDPVAEGPFGCHTKTSEQSAAECMAVYPQSEVARWKLARSEDVYASNRQEPLGHTVSRGYKLPAGLGTEVPFGCSLHRDSNNSTKAIIFPQQSADDDTDPALHKMRLLSHGSFAPGEQRRRDYNWTINPMHHRFGLVNNKAQQCSIKQILQPELDAAVATRPAVVSKVYDVHKATAGDDLGCPRLLGVGNGSLPASHVFGKPSQQAPEPCAGELLRGYYTPAQQAPDADLGKALREGWRNVEVPGRSFGVPSVRDDIPTPASKSVANTKNYGNEPTAWQLLAPPKCVDVRVRQEDLLVLRDRQQLAELLIAADVTMPDKDFEAVYQLAVQADGVPGQQQCSLDSFMRAKLMYLRQQAGLC